MPLPKRGQTDNTQHQIALLIREGRIAAQRLATGIGGASVEATSSKQTSFSQTMETMTSLSTVLEQDFTVEGKKGLLACPFSREPTQDTRGTSAPVDDSHGSNGAADDPTPHKSSDPICAAMLEETAPATSQAAAASKCPIRFLDKHSPEEIAKYVETHKHEIPRSHEVCVRRYQRNEEQIRKLDAKYGNLVSMIKDLGNLHQPMLPSPEGGEQVEVDRASNERVESWAQGVTTSDPELANEAPTDDDRESRFDRPLRDVRLGESPSRPWGISVPLAAGFPQEDSQRPESPPPAPVMMLDPLRPSNEPTGPKKCPFDHTKMSFPLSFPATHGHGTPNRAGGTDHEPGPSFTPPKAQAPPSSPPRPVFVNPVDIAASKAEKGNPPQMVFNISGPVFIGYPMEQAIEFLQRYQGR